MFNEVDAILKTYLTKGLGDAIPESHISFEAPGKDYQPAPTSLNCLLYEVSENEGLRSNERSFDRAQDGTALVNRAPFWLNCEYLITAWAGSIEEEHRLLGKVFTTLLSLEVNPKSALRTVADKIKSTNVMIRYNRNNHARIDAVWQASGLRPRLGLSYTLICSIDKQEPEQIQLVKEKVINLEVEKEIVQ